MSLWACSSFLLKPMRKNEGMLLLRTLSCNFYPISIIILQLTQMYEYFAVSASNGTGTLSILSAHSHHLTQPILLGGRPFIILTVSDWLPDQTQFAFCQLETWAKFACNSTCLHGNTLRTWSVILSMRPAALMQILFRQSPLLNIRSTAYILK